MQISRWWWCKSNSYWHSLNLHFYKKTLRTINVKIRNFYLYKKKARDFVLYKLSTNAESQLKPKIFHALVFNFLHMYNFLHKIDCSKNLAKDTNYGRNIHLRKVFRNEFLSIHTISIMTTQKNIRWLRAIGCYYIYLSIYQYLESLIHFIRSLNDGFLPYIRIPTR